MAIPGSFLIGILFLYLFGMTINIVVLFSLILAVGMLVDGAIVGDRVRRPQDGGGATTGAWPTPPRPNAWRGRSRHRR